MIDLIDFVILGSPLRRWALALMACAGVLALIALWRWVVTHRFRPLALRTNTFLDDVAVVLAETTFGPIAVLLAAYTGSLLLDIETGTRLGLHSVAVVIFLIQAGIWGSALITRWVDRYGELNRETNIAGAGTARLIGLLARLALYSIVLLLILDNIPGVEVTALVASLGIGGIAVALATQNILGDLFASLSIALDKPFVVGDFISVGADSGTVEQIGLKTTRLKSLSGEQLIFSNGDLLGSRIRNFARQTDRRVAFTFRVPYGTPAERLRTVPDLMRGIIEPLPDTRFDRAHLLRFDDIGLAFEVVYFVTVADFQRHADIQQQVILALLDGLAERGIDFAHLAEEAAQDQRARKPNQP